MNAKRGEIWYVNLDAVRGSEQAGVRPVLILQNDRINKATTTTLVIPFTTNLRRAALPSCVRVPQGEGGLTAEFVLLCHQLRVLDESRFSHKLGKVSEQVMSEVELCVLYTMGIGAKTAS